MRRFHLAYSARNAASQHLSEMTGPDARPSPYPGQRQRAEARSTGVRDDKSGTSTLQRKRMNLQRMCMAARGACDPGEAQIPPPPLRGVGPLWQRGKGSGLVSTVEERSGRSAGGRRNARLRERGAQAVRRGAMRNRMMRLRTPRRASLSFRDP